MMPSSMRMIIIEFRLIKTIIIRMIPISSIPLPFWGGAPILSIQITSSSQSVYLSSKSLKTLIRIKFIPRHEFSPLIFRRFLRFILSHWAFSVEQISNEVARDAELISILVILVKSLMITENLVRNCVKNSEKICVVFFGILQINVHRAKKILLEK
jgi:hypothetical protein